MQKLKANYQIMDKHTLNIDILRKLETVGRVCYKSEDKITEDSARKFIKKILSNHHESVLEHSLITVKFICDRGISHEVVRHRIGSYSQESTRYCNYAKDKFNNTVKYIDIAEGIDLDGSMKHMSRSEKMEIFNVWLEACEDSERHYLKMIELGASPQIARSVLNTSVKTELVMSYNPREWREFFKQRTHISAHPQMRQLTIPLLMELNSLIPVIFEDLVWALKEEQ